MEVCVEREDGSFDTILVNWFWYLIRWLFGNSYQKGECPASPIRGQGFEFPQNPSDPTILNSVFEDGAKISFLGTKDTQTGDVLSVDRFFVEEEDGATIIAQVQDNRLTSISNSEDGFDMELQWQSETQVAIKATLGGKSYSVEVDTAAQSTSGDSSQPQEPPLVSFPMSPRTNANTQPNNNRDRSLLERALPRKLQGLRRVILELTRCGFTYTEAVVRLSYTLQGEGQTESDSVWGSPLSDGSGYFFWVPTQIEDNLQIVVDACEAVVPTIDLVCDDLQVGGAMGSPALRAAVCVGLAAAIDVIIAGPTGEGAAIAVACERALNKANKACAVIDPSFPTPDLPGGGSVPAPVDIDLVKEICNAIEVDEPFLATTWDLSARIIYPLGSSFLAQVGEVTGAVIPPELDDFMLGTTELEDDPVPIIENLKTDPFNPDPNQGYVTTATSRCVNGNSGQSVSLSIVGTDGYTDSTICVPATAEASDCVLIVPGATAGVLDVLTAEILPSGDTKEISIIF